MDKKVNLAIIGNGGIAHVHAKCLLQVKDASFVAVAGHNREKVEQFAEQYHVRPYTSIDKLLKNEDIDGVIICTPTHTHLEIAQTVAAAGKHILCEKPITRTLREADEMIRITKKNKVKLMMEFPLRFHFAKVRDLIRSGAVGKIHAITSYNLGWTPQTEWFFDPDKGGGVIIDTFVHIADLLRWFSESEVERVYSEGLASLLRGSRKMRTEDNAMCLLRLKNGSIAEAYVSWTAKNWWGTDLEIFGSKGAIFCHPTNKELMVFSSKEVPDEFMVKGWNSVPAYSRMLEWVGWVELDEHFVNCILEDSPPAISGEDGRAALEVALAAFESARTNLPVRLPLKA